MMSKEQIAEAITKTTLPDDAQRKAGEAYLKEVASIFVEPDDQVEKIVGFLPHVLEVAMDANLTVPVRQGAAIYMKNSITKSWGERGETEVDVGSDSLIDMIFSRLSSGFSSRIGTSFARISSTRSSRRPTRSGA